MEQIKILFFALSSFFAIEDGRIAADKTTVTIDPEPQEIKIVQDNLFTIIQNEEDKTIVLKQWKDLLNWEEKQINWTKELDSFPVKKLIFIPIQDSIKPKILLSYKNESHLRAMGIWYNSEKNQFSINNIPRNNIKTADGNLEGNYWIFKADKKFSFTLEPFSELPEHYKKSKKTIEELALKSTKTKTANLLSVIK